MIFIILMVVHTMQVYLRRKGTYISCTTVHKYMKKMQLFSVSRRKKPGYVHGAAHKVYDNRLKQNFHAKKRNRKWCTDFTYLSLADGRKCYNCAMIVLYDRSIIASIMDRNDTSFGSGKPGTHLGSSQNSVLRKVSPRA